MLWNFKINHNFRPLPTVSTKLICGESRQCDCDQGETGEAGEAAVTEV